MKRGSIVKRGAIYVLLSVLTCVLATQAGAQSYTPNYGALFGSIVNIGSGGGTVQAENFNSNNGDICTGYYGVSSGNAGTNTTYRTGVDVDLYNGATGIYIQSSIPTDLTPQANGNPVAEKWEWVNYQFHITQAGWYQIQYYGMSGDGYDNVFTLVDDYSYGVSAPNGGSFALTTAAAYVHLNVGDHNIKLVMIPTYTYTGGQYHYGCAIDYITFNWVAAPTQPTPRIVTTTLPSDEVVVADAVVTDSPFYADSTGVNDSTNAFQTAIYTEANLGGGTVYAPAGTYRIDGTLYIPANVTLRGDWASPLGSGNGTGTVLKATYASASISSPFIYLAWNSAVRYLSVWYPNQTNTSSPTQYSWTIYSPGNAESATNITLYNSYNGISLAGSCTDIHNIYGTPLSTGVQRYAGWDYGYMYNVTLQNSIWKNMPAGFNPPTGASANSLDDYTNANTIGVWQGQYDAGEVYNINVSNANTGFLVKQVPGDAHSFYGSISKINADIQDVDTYPFGIQSLHFVNTDLVSATSSMNYTFAAMRKPARTGTSDFFNVKANPYNAVGDGLADDSTAIQTALTAAQTNGGGTVYLPQGQYKVTTPLTIPSGVELRGSMTAIQQAMNRDNCALLVCQGQDSPGGTPFITLNTNAGVRGFQIVYPVQGYGSASNPTAPVHAYPTTIKGNGTGVWVVDVCPINAYVFLDLGSAACDNHLVSGLWGTTLAEGICVAGNSQNGVIEKAYDSHGHLSGVLRACGPFSYGLNALQSYMSGTCLPYVFGSCSGETGFGINSFAVNQGMLFWNDGGAGCTNATFWDPSSDTAANANYVFQKGGTINLIGMAAGGENNWVMTTSTFGGTVNLYDKYTWSSNGLSHWYIPYGTVNRYDEHSLNYGRQVWANSYHATYEDPAYATDAVGTSKWCALTKDTSINAYWLRVDLGQPTDITRWAIYNANMNGEGSIYNTSSADLQVSSDGTTWNIPTGCSVTGNTVDMIDRYAPATLARYVRLKVNNGTQSGYDGYARISDFMTYGLNNRNGWQFATNTTEGWTAVQQSSLAVNSGPQGYTHRLVVTSSGAAPIIQSSDNLYVESLKYSGVQVRMTNGTSSTSAKLQWITQCDTTWNDAKSCTISISASQHNLSTYTFSVPSWQSAPVTIRQLRITPATASGTITVASIAFVDASAPTPSPNYYYSYADFQADPQTQGYRGWSWQYLTGGVYTNMPTKNFATDLTLTWQYTGGNGYCRAGSYWQCPDYSGSSRYDAVKTWVAPVAGTVSITGAASLQAPTQTNGVIVSIKRNTTTLWGPVTLNSTTPSATPTGVSSVAVAAGDKIYFTTSLNGTTPRSDLTNWFPAITYQ